MHTSGRRLVAATAAGVLALTGVACSDDDNDGNPEIEAPDVESPDVDAPDMDTPDLDPGEGGGLPGDSSDEAPGDTGATDDLPDPQD